MGTETNKETDRNTPEYLAQLLKDKKQIQAFPSVFVHLERLLDEEISKVRGNLFHLGNTKESVLLPEPEGPVVPLTQKLRVPVKEHPEFNFVGRILGPRGMTAKQLEQDTGCKIMVRGKGSMRDKKKEEMNRGKPNWEHLQEELHVLITVEDTENRGQIKLQRAVEEVKKLLVPAPEGEDELKKMQLMELAIMNGTYRDTKFIPPALLQQLQAQAPRVMTPSMMLPPQLRSPTPAGAPIILAQRFPTPTQIPGAVSPVTSQSQAAAAAVAATNSVNLLNSVNGGPPPLVSPTDPTLMYQYDPYQLAATQLFEYPSPAAAMDHSGAGAVPKVRRHAVGVREHPYGRVSLA